MALYRFHLEQLVPTKVPTLVFANIFFRIFSTSLICFILSMLIMHGPAQLSPCRVQTVQTLRQVSLSRANCELNSPDGDKTVPTLPSPTFYSPSG